MDLSIAEKVLSLLSDLVLWVQAYRGPSLIINASLLGPYSRTIPRVKWWS